MDQIFVHLRTLLNLNQHIFIEDERELLTEAKTRLERVKIEINDATAVILKDFAAFLSHYVTFHEGQYIAQPQKPNADIM